jgi:type VI secretion system protein ImpE
MPMDQPVTGSIAEQVAAASDAVRSSPQALGPRMALFQLDCVMGNWTRARAQLAMMARLDAEASSLAQLYDQLIQSEDEREAVFAGSARPVALGEPTPWMAMLAKALELDASAQVAASRDLRARALDDANAQPGSVDGTAFGWIMDADPRLGPVVELVVAGNYRWLPFEHLRHLRAEPPKALRDAVWQPATVTLANGSEIRVSIPSRYPGSASHGDDAVRLARLTVWEGTDEGETMGYGQRMFATDVDDKPLLDVRSLDIEPLPAGVHALA